uniref:Uncharacterized protein n=1 Tax=Setaria italica TaxID=4555 RepID=K3ZKB4_SETIT
MCKCSRPKEGARTHSRGGLLACCSRSSSNLFLPSPALFSFEQVRVHQFRFLVFFFFSCSIEIHAELEGILLTVLRKCLFFLNDMALVLYLSRSRLNILHSSAVFLSSFCYTGELTLLLKH